PAFPDAPFSLRLAAGEHVQLVESHSLAGSTIAASAPIGVFVGHECAGLPDENADCDHVERMLLPSALLAGERVALGPSRVGEPVQWKLVGAVDDTRLEYSDGFDGPSTLAAGEAVEFAADSPFVVRSQDDAHPFRLLSVMHNCSSLGQVTCPGDAEQLELGGTALYVEDATFFVDPTYARTQLLVVRVADPELADVRLPCAVDELVGEWSPVGKDGRFEVARADFDIPGGRYDACEGGLHRMTSDAPFGAWVWSWDSRNSIAYSVALGTSPYHDAGPGEQ
ncbi:MAG: IgGFc-binding protein, partial [Deltaproteobacteria bacterium]|nr:IgGFc-binding protein [Nannocystaceae bacterium]